MTLDEKRLETFQILLKATKEKRVEWEELGNNGFVAQPGRLAVSIENDGDAFLPVYTAKVTNNAGSIVDQFSITLNANAKDLLYCLKDLYEAAQREVESRISKELDELVEDLRA